MTGRLAGVVHVRDEFGANHVFGPASDVPRWAAEQITNEKAWSEMPAAPELHRPAGNAGVDKWISYAEAMGVTVPAESDKAAIKALIEAQEAK